MKGTICEDIGRFVVREDLPEPYMREGEAIVRVSAHRYLRDRPACVPGQSALFYVPARARPRAFRDDRADWRQPGGAFRREIRSA